MTTDRIPLAHSVVYAVRGVPEVPDEYNAGRTIAPHEITLTYRTTEDSQLGRVHAYVKGWWMQDGQRVPMDKPVGRHFWGRNFADWPEWLAEEARLNDPERAAAPQTPAPQAEAWLDAAAECNKAGGAYAERGANDAAGAAFALMETFLRKAGEAEYVATPCSGPVPCEDGGEPCDVHERLMGHAEGEHELCAPDCGEPWLSRMADRPQPGTDQRVEPINCGLCLYGSDVGVPGYDDKGPAYINPACPDHNTEAMLGVCICGHTEQQHFEDACLVCDCGDYLVPEAAREVIARWREAATRKPADQPAARSCPPDCPCHAVCIGTKQAATETQQDGAQR